MNFTISVKKKQAFRRLLFSVFALIVFYFPEPTNARETHQRGVNTLQRTENGSFFWVDIQKINFDRFSQFAEKARKNEIYFRKSHFIMKYFCESLDFLNFL